MGGRERERKVYPLRKKKSEHQHFILQWLIFSFVVGFVTVEMGRRYFPHCSQVLDKFMEDDLPDLFYLEKGTLDEQRIKRTRFMELKEDVQRAFTKDKAEFNRSGLSSSSSSSSLKDNLSHKARKLWSYVAYCNKPIEVTHSFDQSFWWEPSDQDWPLFVKASIIYLFPCVINH